MTDETELDGKRDGFRAGLVLLGVAAVIAINVLANLLPIGGQTTGQVSDFFRTRLTPAGYAFSIWGVIYLGLIILGIYQILPAHQNRRVLTAIRGPLLVNFAANITWIWLWHHEKMGWSLAAIIAVLLPLVVVYNRLDRMPVAYNSEKWAIRLPISIYLGWVLVATIVNTAVALTALGWTGMGMSPDIWALSTLVIAALLGGWLGLRQADISLSLSMVWGLAAIAVAQWRFPLVNIAAWYAAAFIVAGLMGGWLREVKKRARLQESKRGTADSTS